MNRNQKLLKKFYKELAVWINAGMPEHEVFKKSHALCWQLSCWCDSLPWYRSMFYDFDCVCEEQAKLFFYNTFPFGLGEYMQDKAQKDFYKNKQRLAFIFEHAVIKQENK